MIYVGLKGRLCNNMFCVTFGEYLKRVFGLKVLYFLDEAIESVPKFEKYVRDYFPFAFEEERPEECILSYVNEENISTELSEVYVADEGDTLILGYRQNPNYWENNKDFCLDLWKPIGGLIDYIKELYCDIDFSEYVSINVRTYKQDMAENDIVRAILPQNIGVLDIKYFEDAMKRFSNEQKFLVSSDDIEWCKEHFVGDRFVFVDREAQDERFEKMDIDLWIQTLCSGNIISNSTFSWWGAYLNKNKDRRVICPMPFFRSQPNSFGIYPENDNFEIIEAKYK